MDALCRFHDRARREGIPGLEYELFSIGPGFFELGTRLIVDGLDARELRSVLSTHITHESDYYKRILKQIIMEGVLDIQAGCSLEKMIIKLNSMVSIKDNFLSEKITEYLCGDIHALETCFDTVIPRRPAPEEREEIVFIKRALALSEKARREGLLALEPEIDKAGIASCDIFEYGLPFIIDGEDAAFIDRILGNLIAHENDPEKKNLGEAKKEALLSIQAGDNPRILLKKCISYFGEDIRQIARKLFDDED
jgi:flagellar motor component MotA